MTHRRTDGFTLVEVLVAFAILALVLGAVFRSYSAGLAQERIASEATRRVLEARSFLTALGTDVPLEEGTSEGRFPSGEIWTLTVERVQFEGEAADADADPRLYHATLSVTGTDGRAVTLQTLKPGP